MVWKTIAFLKFNTDLNLKTVLNDYETQIEEDDNLLRGVIRISKVEKFKDDKDLIRGIILKEFMTKIKKLEKIITDGITWNIRLEKVKTTNLSNFWLVAKNCLIVFDTTFDRYHSIYVLREALSDQSLSIPTINITELANNYDNHWLGGFIERQSNVNSGMLYGEDIRYDPEIGDAYQITTKNQVGIRERVGRKRMKVKITSHGFIQFFRTVEDEDIYDFLNRCIFDYII